MSLENQQQGDVYSNDPEQYVADELEDIREDLEAIAEIDHRLGDRAQNALGWLEEHGRADDGE